MKIEPGEFEVCKELFIQNKSTLEVQLYLSDKYQVPKCKTSNFIKAVRKSLGIYGGEKSPL
jgi:hypothetical protein